MKYYLLLTLVIVFFSACKHSASDTKSIHDTTGNIVEDGTLRSRLINFLDGYYQAHVCRKDELDDKPGIAGEWICTTKRRILSESDNQFLIRSVSEKPQSQLSGCKGHSQLSIQNVDAIFLKTKLLIEDEKSHTKESVMKRRSYDECEKSFAGNVFDTIFNYVWSKGKLTES